MFTSRYGLDPYIQFTCLSVGTVSVKYVTVRYIIWLCTKLCIRIHCSCLTSLTALCGPAWWPSPPCIETHTVAKGAIGNFTLRSGLHIYTLVTEAQVLLYVAPNDSLNSCSRISVMFPHGLLIICWFVRSVEDGVTHWGNTNRVCLRYWIWRSG